MAKLIAFVFIAAICAALTTAEQTPTNNVCKGTCTRDFKPLCGKNNQNKMETFPNRCLFEFKQCSEKNAGWEIVQEHGPCGGQQQHPKVAKRQTCQSACTFKYEPVCGKNAAGKLRTFGNKCEFDWIKCSQSNEGWTYVGKNECVEEGKDGSKIILLKRDTTSQAAGCPTICPAIYKPVCAQSADGKPREFPNSCALSVENCLNGNKYTLIKDGPCSGNQKVKRNVAENRLKRQCPTVCTLEYAPVCARDSSGQNVTFPNRCAMNVENCPNQRYTFVRNGKC